MEKKLNTKILVQMSLAVAITFVLSLIKVTALPQGGGVSFGTYVPIMLISYFYGFKKGLLTAIVYGTLNLIFTSFIISFLQVLLDYYIPVIALCIFAFHKKEKNIIFITSIIGSLVLASHFLSGIVFYAQYAGGVNVYLYSLIYNGSYVIPETIITIFILIIINVEKIKNLIK